LVFLVKRKFFLLPLGPINQHKKRDFSQYILYELLTYKS
jgi:hypothetical protein